MSLLEFDIFNGWHFPSKTSLVDFQRPFAFIIPLQMYTPEEAYLKYIMTMVSSSTYLWLGILWSSAVLIIEVTTYTATWKHGEMFLLFAIVFKLKNGSSGFAVEFISFLRQSLNFIIQKWVKIYKFFSTTVSKTFSHDKLYSCRRGAQGASAEVWRGQTDRCPISPDRCKWQCVRGAHCHAFWCSCVSLLRGLRCATCLMDICPSCTRWIFLASYSPTYQNLDVLSD